MADRFWVGGTASWDGTAGTKWAATSGGAGGESVPTPADDVFFDANSSGTCTIAAGNTGAKSINCTGFTGGIAGTALITVAGSITLDAGQTYTHTGTVTITGTGTLTTAGKTFSAVTVNGSGIAVTLGDALNTATRVTAVSQGTFDTDNFNVTCITLNMDGTSARTVNLGSSTITLSNQLRFLTSTNLTINAGTSQINISGNNGVQGSGSFTLHNVSFTSTAAGSRQINGANTFNDLTLNASATGLSQLQLSDDQTVNGTFTCAGSSSIARGFVRSNVIGTTRTITAAVVSANDCDFRDITIAGVAAPISPTRAGDCGGNSGITFPAAKSAFRVGTDTTWAGSSSWALTSGGAGSNDNFPLAQDTAVVDNNTALTGTLSLVAYNVGSLDCSVRTTGITLGFNGTLFYGDYTLGSGVTVSGTNASFFLGRGTQTFTSAGKTITFAITVDNPAVAFELGDALVSSNNVLFTRGTFDAKNYNVTCSRFNSSSNNTRTITMGSGLWTLSGPDDVWNTTFVGNLTFNKDNADILLSNTSTAARNFQGGGLTYNKLTIGGASGTSTTTIGGSTASANSFTELASTKTVAHTIRFSATQTIDTWSVTGTSGNVVTINSTSAGTRRTISLTNATSDIDYLDVKDIGITDPDKFYVGDNSTDSGNNLNVIFTAAPGGNVDVPVTGVEAISAIGSVVVVIPDVVVPVTGVTATGQVGDVVVVIPDVIVPVTGVSAAGQVGSVVVSASADVAVTGVSASGEIGTVVVFGSALALATGVEATGQVGDVIVPNVDVTVTGVFTTGQVGQLGVSAGAAAAAIGVEAAGEVGQVATTGTAVILPTGVEATGQVGDVIIPNVEVTVTGVSATGSVGELLFPDVDVLTTGVSAAAQVGSVAVAASALALATGVEATGEVGSVTALPSIEVPVTGVSSSGEVGTVNVVGEANLTVTGVSTSGAVGNVIAFASVVADATGLEATGEVGSVQVSASAQIIPFGVSAAGAVGDVDVIGTSNTVLTGVEGTGQVGTAQGLPSIEVPVTGVSATGAVGSVAITASATVFAVGVSAVGRVGQANVWGKIVPDPGTSWTDVDPSGTTTWTDVDPSATTIWNDIAA
jgi:hypothetical protein